ncbi:alpha/beta hydrolase [Photobacterium profundum]|uniref:alpha/beta hydrolase n=1 Tax=Photobacterium profundum TaxID=74109 RepID=UPI003D131161
MNLEIINKLLKNNLPKYFFTLSTNSRYFVELGDDTLTILTKRGKLETSINDFYVIISHVMSIKSFRVSEYKNNYKNVSYLLPIVKWLVVESGDELEAYIAPKGGWKEPSELNEQLSGIEVFKEEYIVEKRSESSICQSICYSAPLPIENVLVEVHYATNRKSDDKEYFSGKKDTKVNLGIAKVSIPKNKHKRGRIEKPLTCFKVIFREDRSKHFVIDSNFSLNEDEFYSDLKYKSDNKSLMIFIHGYNVSFKNAIYNAAQIKYDLDYESPIMLFSWPSQAKVLSYVSDKESALHSALALADILEKIDSLDVDEVVIIGHSMGSLCLAEAIKSYKSTNKSFKRVALAAADINQDTFVDIYSERMKQFFESVTLYASSSDLALNTSSIVNRSNRIGSVKNGITVIDGIDTIDMSDADKNIFTLGHSYVSKTSEALNDIYYNLVQGLSVESRTLKTLYTEDSLQYWSIYK